VALVGVSLYRTYFGVAAGPGPGPKRETIAGARLFVVPNPSGLNASFPGFESKLIWFKQLRLFVERVARAGQTSSPTGRTAKAVD
jgi:TDG/mug DNA glycosylase family protein